MSNRPLLTVVVPTRNEAGNVGRLYQRLSAALVGVSFDVCYVDDSDDGVTRDELQALTVRHPAQVRCILRDGEARRGGLSTALSQGFRAARGRHVISIDCDLQHPPEAIPAMLAAAEGGADLVVASRYVPGGDPGGLDGRWRRLVSRGAAAVSRLLFAEARATTDPCAGFFLCRRSILDGVEFRPVGFKYLLEILVCIPGLRVADVPIVFGERAHGESKATLDQGRQFLRHLLSLFLHVRGSARGWKFGLVGFTGLLVFLGILDGAALLGLPLQERFALAFAASFLLNTVLNRTWTCADAGRSSTAVWLRSTAVSAVAMPAGFWLLTTRGWAPEVAAVAGAMLGGAVRALGNRAVLRRQRRAGLDVFADQAVGGHLAALRDAVGADRVLVVASPDTVALSGLAADAVALAARRRLPLLLTEAPSHRPQRRSNVEAESAIAVPVLGGDGGSAPVVVCLRRDPAPFGQAQLDLAVDVVNLLGSRLAA